jgi:hypothetical protein
MRVPAPPQDDRKPPDITPDPELNPMTNTLLAQNMGRWAEVYFTTPVEKRDEAVQELLRELRSGIKRPREAPVESIATEEEIIAMKEKLLELQKEQLAKSSNKRSVSTPVPASEAMPSDGVICPACLSRNKMGQRFCGLCGFSLVGNQPTAEAVKESQPELTPTHVSTEPVRDGNDWGWLHERNRTQLASSKQRSGTWKYVLVLLIIVGVGAAGYWWWRISLSTNAAVEKTSKDTNENARNNEGHSTSGNKQAEISSKPMNPGAEIDKRTPVRDDTRVAPSEHLKSRAGTEATFSAEDGAPNVSQEQGLRELQTARTYLEGRGVPKDSTVAAQWLWKAVAKQNTEAAIILSRMYMLGDGVQKNCDQARLLLMPAAKRGSKQADEALQTVTVNCQ